MGSNGTLRRNKWTWKTRIRVTYIYYTYLLTYTYTVRAYTSVQSEINIFVLLVYRGTVAYYRIDPNMHIYKAIYMEPLRNRIDELQFFFPVN